MQCLARGGEVFIRQTLGEESDVERGEIGDTGCGRLSEKTAISVPGPAPALLLYCDPHQGTDQLVV